jgi:hypothetical protein
MDCLPSQDVIDGITVALFPKPSNSQPPKRNSIEYFIHITERVSKSTFHGVVGGCMFCGHNRKWTVGQIRIHYTKESEGATHVHACPQVPQEITQFYRDVRDTFLAQQKLKSAKAVSCLRDEMSLATLGSESSPQSSQGQPGSAGSTPKRPRPICDQPTIEQSFVSPSFAYQKIIILF